MNARTIMLRQWFDPEDWAWLKQQTGTTHDRPVILIEHDDPLVRQADKRAKNRVPPVNDQAQARRAGGVDCK